MIDFERSLDIALSMEPVEANLPEISAIPLARAELLVVKRGLTKHIDILHRGVARRASEDRALVQVFNFLSDDVDRFRKRSHDVARVLDPDAPEVDDSKVVAAMAIASLKRGMQYKQDGEWPKKKKAAEELASKFIVELVDINSLDFFELRKQNHRLAESNIQYWINELKKFRISPYMDRLREAIEESDHYPIEV